MHGLHHLHALIVRDCRRRQKIFDIGVRGTAFRAPARQSGDARRACALHSGLSKEKADLACLRYRSMGDFQTTAPLRSRLSRFHELPARLFCYRAATVRKRFRGALRRAGGTSLRAPYAILLRHPRAPHRWLVRKSSERSRWRDEIQARARPETGAAAPAAGHAGEIAVGRELIAIQVPFDAQPVIQRLHGKLQIGGSLQFQHRQSAGTFDRQQIEHAAIAARKGRHLIVNRRGLRAARTRVRSARAPAIRATLPDCAGTADARGPRRRGERRSARSRANRSISGRWSRGAAASLRETEAARRSPKSGANSTPRTRRLTAPS